MYEHINEYVNPRLFDGIGEKERERKAQIESDLDYCADAIDDGDDICDVYNFFLKDHRITEKEFIEAMDERGVRVVYAQLHPKKFEYVINEKYIPVEWILEKLWKSENYIEEIDGETEERLRKVMKDWQEFVKEKEMN